MILFGNKCHFYQVLSYKLKKIDNKHYQIKFSFFSQISKSINKISNGFSIEISHLYLKYFLEQIFVEYCRGQRE
jgi:hypothetical protein